MADTDELENMVLSFRVSELQMLLGFAGRNKSGRKDELQTRALELLKLRSHHAELKIRELYKTIQANQLSAHQMYGQSGTGNEPSIDQNLHQRSDDSRQSHNLSWARAMRSRPNQQQPLLILVSQKDLPPAHQASMPQSQVTRSAAAYQPTTHNTVTAQAIIKNAQKLGLIGEEKNKFNCPEIYRVLNQLTALTFLPPSQVIKTFHQLQNKTKEDFGNHFDQLFEYYESQWLKQTKPEGFNVYGSHEDRTDNIMEAHHRDRNRDLEKNLLPSIFIGPLKKIPDVSRVDINQIELNNNEFQEMWKSMNNEIKNNGTEENIDYLEYINNLKCIKELEEEELKIINKNLNIIQQNHLNETFELDFEDLENYERLIVNIDNKVELTYAMSYINRRYLQNANEKIIYVKDDEIEKKNIYIYYNY